MHAIRSNGHITRTPSVGLQLRHLKTSLPPLVPLAPLSYSPLARFILLVGRTTLTMNVAAVADMLISGFRVTLPNGISVCETHASFLFSPSTRGSYCTRRCLGLRTHSTPRGSANISTELHGACLANILFQYVISARSGTRESVNAIRQILGRSRNVSHPIAAYLPTLISIANNLFAENWCGRSICNTCPGRRQI